MESFARGRVTTGRILVTELRSVRSADRERPEPSLDAGLR